MSVKAISWALDEVVDTSPAETLVLFALADFADNDGVSWHSLEKLAKRARCSTRTLRTHFKTLEALGLLSREPRYAWCKDVEGACATRPAHKHRSGTTYRLHLEVTGEELQARIAELKAGGKSTEENLSPVEETAEFQGNVHRGKIFPCEGVEGSTVENLRSPQRKQSVTICNIEPSIKPPIHTKPKVVESSAQAVFETGAAGLGGSGADVLVDSSAFGVDESLLLACIPESMRGFDRRGMSLVWAVLKPLLDAGVSPGAVKNYLNSGTLPERVSYMPGLIASRLERMVYVVPSTSGNARGGALLDEVLYPACEELTPAEKALESLAGRVRGTALVSRPYVVARVCQVLASSVRNDSGCSELEACEALLALGGDEFYSLVEDALGGFEVAL
ncbi:MAG: helix-turn-helix domain-containing protein [Actinomycetaceae bacterium]|nr:helix-turn-helix domain-containing protein [Actinomycetaceae bacterium]